ncbi:unnamed protein product [Calypogeia fissa]
MDMDTSAEGLSKHSADLSTHSVSWDPLLLGVVTLVVIAVSYGVWRRKKTTNSPPGPRGWPVIGALLEMEPQLHKTLDKFAKRYGDIVLCRLGVQTIVVVSSAEGAEELLKHRDAEFCDRATAMTRSVAKYTGLGGAEMPFANYDTELKLHRKISITEFFTAAKIKLYEKLRTQEVAVMVEKIFHAKIQHSTFRREPMGIRSIGCAAIRNIVFSLCIGRRFDSLRPEDELKEFPEILDELAQLFMSINLVDFFPWLTWFDPQGLLKRMKTFDKRQRRWYEMILEQHRLAMKQQKGESGELEGGGDETNSTTRNFVDVLLRAQEDGTKISDDGVMGTIMSMLCGGIDTTSSQVEWVLLELARHPKMLQRLQYELDAFVGKERPLDENDLTFMPFLNAVVLESLRLHPAVPYSFPHVNMAPATLGGYDIPAKTAVIVNAYSIGRDPKTWKNPLEFNPDRFMAGGSSLSSDSIKANGNYYQLLPFSSGRRVCPGYNLAILLLLRIVGTLVHAFNWIPPPGLSAEELSIEEVSPFIIHPNPDLYLVPTPRLPAHVYRSNIKIT